jgi:NtrC-family two-component system sensor histidine kinase KinB
MQVNRNTSIISWALGILTIIVLLLNLPEQPDPANIGLWLLFTLLIALSLNLGVLLTSGEISSAHMFGIMAFLSLGHDGRAEEALWIVATGALLGGLVQVARAEEWLPRRRVTVRSLGSVLETMAQLTLSQLVGEALYLQSGGRLPLGVITQADIFPLIIFAVGYVLFYLLFFVLRVRMEGHSISDVLASDWVTLGGAVLLPVPFGILGGVVSNELDTFSWAIFVGGLVLIVFGVYGLSRMQFYFRQQVQELSSISVVSQALRTNLELDALLKTIHLQVASLLNVDNFMVALLEPLQNRIYFPLVVTRGHEIDLPPRAPEPNERLLDYVIDRRMPLLLEQNVGERTMALNLRPPDGPIYSWLGVPLLAPDRALGAIAVASSDPGRLLSTADQRLLMNIAAQAGVAIENAQLYGQAQDRALQLGTLNSISALLTGTLSPEKVVNLVASSVVAVANCDAVAVYLYEDGDLQLARNIGLSEAFNSDPPIPLIIRPGDADDPHRPGHQPVVVSSANSEPLLSDAERAFITREGMRAWIELMLMSGDAPQGVVVAYYQEPRHFSGDEIELIRTFTVQAALAINNARIYNSIDSALDRRMSQLQALYDVGQELNAILSLQHIFDLVVERALEGTSGEAGLVVVGQEDGFGIEVVAHQGYPPDTFDTMRIGSGITALVYDTGEPLLVADVRENRHYRAVNPNTHSQLSVPIMRENEILGVITIESTNYNAFGEDDITFVTQLAIQAAIAIDNARLFKRIAEGRDRLQVILDSMTEGVLLINNDGQVALANPRIESLLGLKPETMVRQLVDDLLLDPDMGFAQQLGFSEADLRLLLADLRAGDWRGEEQANFSYELDAPRHVYVNRHIAPVMDENGALLGLLLVLVDETEQQELVLARDDLNRMIVHDLRGPMTAVTASLKLLNDLAPPDSNFTPIVQRTTEASMRAVRKLLNLVDSLLDIGKMESGQMTLDREPVHLNALASNVVMEMDSLARELDVNLAVDIPYDMPLLDVDGNQVERVLLNLVDNALKFTPADGVVRIAAYKPEERDVPAGFVRVEVSDTGPGVPDDYKARLFDRFVQVKSAQSRRRGTGLGLTFCRLATESHGGAIWIEDNPEGGAMFAFTLPVATDLNTADQPATGDLDFDGPLL